MSAISQTQTRPAETGWFFRACGSWVHTLVRLAKVEKAGQSFMLLALRLLYGFGLAMAGWGKFGNLEGTGQFFASLGIPAPTFTAGLVATIELVGGVMLLLGLGTRLATLPIIATMGVALMTAHGAEITDLKTFMAQSPYPFLLVGLILLAFGPGAVSFDRLLKRVSRRCVEPKA